MFGKNQQLLVVLAVLGVLSVLGTTPADAFQSKSCLEETNVQYKFAAGRGDVIITDTTKEKCEEAFFESQKSYAYQFQGSIFMWNMRYCF